jgi:PAS domain S-box-containing protein
MTSDSDRDHKKKAAEPKQQARPGRIGSRRTQKTLRESGRNTGLKPDSTLSPEGDIRNLELADIIDTRSVQPLMEDFHRIIRIPLAIIDLKGEVLVGVGWQDVCMKFHRVHPETCKHCIESDTVLSAGVPKGEIRLYKCKNNMWDVATPVMIGGIHAGNLFLGQFFFEGEPLDYELFRSQARQYSFNEEDYIASLEAVPRLSRDYLNAVMSFFAKLAHMISELSYSNLRLAQALTERDAFMNSLRESREDLNRAQAVAHTGSWRLNLHLNELVWSDEAYRIFGIPQGTPMSYDAFLNAVHPEDRELVDRLWKAALRGEPYELEHRIIADGQVKWVLERAEFDEQHGLAGGFGTVQDITDHRRAEDEFKRLSYTNRLLLESAGDGICGVDAEGFVTFINKAGAAMLGYKAGELIGEKSHSKWHYKKPDGTPYPSEECPIYAAYKDGLDRTGQEVFWTKKGAGLPIDFTSRPIYEDGRIAGAVFTFKDITERKQAEEERERLISDLGRSNRELEQFAYVASHDLQEPLRMVASYVQLLQKRYKGKLDVKADQYIHFAVDGALRMQKLIEGLLAYSRITRRGADFRTVDTNHIFSQAVSNLSAAIQDSMAIITKDHLPAVPGDENQLIQLFQNLIGNAMKFRKPDTPPLVHVSAKRGEAEWIFSVRDNGIGISPEYYDRVFLIFQRLHTRQEYPGTGIGLALCKRIIERHNGHIWVESVPGEGTIFFFTIPFEINPDPPSLEKDQEGKKEN